VIEENRTRRVLQAFHRLQSKYGAQEPPAFSSPLEAFLAGIMLDSVSRSRAYEAVGQLKKRFVDWNEARVSTGKEIAEYCSPVSVPEATGRMLQRALDKIHSDWNAMTLDPLKEKNAKQAREYLARFEGLSPAAVAYTMLYGLRKASIPVTQPVLRFAQRLGVVEEGCPPDRAERYFERILPSSRMADFFELVSEHAEEICQQKALKCRKCVTARICNHRKGVRSTVKVLSRPTRQAAARRAAPSARQLARPRLRRAARRARQKRNKK
jgi:endonuclease III